VLRRTRAAAPFPAPLSPISKNLGSLDVFGMNLIEYRNMDDRKSAVSICPKQSSRVKAGVPIKLFRSEQADNTLDAGLGNSVNPLVKSFEQGIALRKLLVIAQRPLRASQLAWDGPNERVRL
jgi:hypothetical protein